MRYLIGTILFIASVFMFYYTFYFWFQEETAIIALASFYIALFMSFSLCISSVFIIVYRKDKSE